MYCPHFHLEDRQCTGICESCPYGFKPVYTMPAQYNYKCPECGGEFNEPFTPQVTSAISYKCPFCGKEMRGMY